MDKKNLMFEMTVDTAMEFYKRCIDQKAETPEEKTKILVDLAKEGRMRSVMATNRSMDQVTEDMKKNFGNILVVKGKNKGSNCDNGHQ